MDLSPDYVSMCVEAAQLQQWWRTPPSGVPLISNIHTGDFFHLGREAHPEWLAQQTALVVSKTVVACAEPYFDLQIAGSIGGHWYIQKHRQATAEVREVDLSLFESGYAVWLPRFDQLAAYFWLLDRSKYFGGIEGWLHLVGAMHLSHPGESMEAVALRVVMGHCHDLHAWDGREWSAEL